MTPQPEKVTSIKQMNIDVWACVLWHQALPHLGNFLNGICDRLMVLPDKSSGLQVEA